LLYYFYLAAFRVPLAYIDGYITTDSLPVNRTFEGWRLFLHDFTASFFIYLKAISSVRLIRHGSEFEVAGFEYNSKLSGYSFSRLVWTKEFKLVVNGDNSMKFEDESLNLEALCESY
jgi:hypothetical protein